MKESKIIGCQCSVLFSSVVTAIFLVMKFEMVCKGWSASPGQCTVCESHRALAALTFLKEQKLLNKVLYRSLLSAPFTFILASLLE